MLVPEKALTIRQPWAWAVFHAGKDLENRPRPTRYRGPVLVHASKGISNATRAMYHEHLTAHDLGGVQTPTDADLLTECGGILGVVDIVDCVETHGSPWYIGPYAYVLENPRLLPFFPCPGQLGFWSISPAAKSFYAVRQSPSEPVAT